MRVPGWLLAAALTLAACSTGQAPESRQAPAAAGPGVPWPDSPAHEFIEVAGGVYSALGTGTMNVGSNSAVIVNDEDVLIVDSHITPASARVLLEEIGGLTDRPVRFVVNTHYHFDHAHGNQVFGDGVLVIGSEFTRQALLGPVLEQRTYRSFTDALPAQIEALRSEIEATVDPDKQAELKRRLAVQEAYAAALRELSPTPPNLTMRRAMTLFRGDREIQLHFFGRGHTGGDIVVYLPNERVLMTGDLLPAGLPYMGDGYVDEWVETLEHLKAFDFEWVIPGHGRPFQERVRIDRLQAYLQDLWAQVVTLRAAGVSPEEAAARVDLSAHREHYPAAAQPGASPVAVLRIYELLEAGLAGPR